MGSLTGAMTVLPGWLGLDREGFEVGIGEVARTLLTSNRHPRESGNLSDRSSAERHRTVPDPRIG